MRSECHAIFPKNSRKRASYVVGRLVSQAIECSIVRQRLLVFGEVRNFRCSEAVIGERRFGVDTESRVLGGNNRPTAVSDDTDAPSVKLPFAAWGKLTPMDTRNLRQTIEQEIDSCVYQQHPTAVGAAMPQEWVTQQLAEMRAALVEPVLRLVEIRDTLRKCDVKRLH